MNGTNKNQKVLDDFVAYCAAHPELRWWQAIYGFTGYSTISVGGDKYDEVPVDPYYFQNKND